MPLPSDAYPEPPRVDLSDGDIVLTGPGCHAAYTVEAARALRGALDEALRRVEAARGGIAGWKTAAIEPGDPESVNGQAGILCGLQPMARAESCTTDSPDSSVT